MWSIRTRLAAVAALGVGCLGFAAGANGAVAASHHHGTASKKHPSGPGFYVTNGKSAQKVTSSSAPAAFIQDPSGNQHVVTTVKSSSASGNQGHIVYYTKRHNSKEWKAHNVPGLRPLAGGVQVQIGLSDGEGRIFAVFYQCDGVYVADASTNANRLPEPTLVQSADTCASPQPASNNPPIAHAFAVNEYDSTIGILLPDPNQSGAPAVWTGKPGGTFTPGTALPTADSFVPVQMAGDGSNNMIAVGYGSDGTNKGVYVTERRYGSWSAPHLVASLGSPTDNYRIESVVADNSIDIGLQRQTGNRGLFLVHGLRSGQWQGVIRLKHTSAKDTSLRLYINPASGHLHALFTRHGSKRTRGVMFLRHGEHGWNKPSLYTHSVHDIAQQMAVASKNKAIIGYLHK
jgi:hypothetical protein